MIFAEAQKEFESVIFKAVRDKIRNGKIKLLKTYIQIIGCLRMAAIGAAGLSAIVSLFVVGLTLVGVGVVGLLPITPEAFYVILLSVGALFSLVSGVILFMFFSQKNWLKHAKVQELMEMVLEDEKNGTKEGKTLRAIFDLDSISRTHFERDVPVHPSTTPS